VLTVKSFGQRAIRFAIAAVLLSAIATAAIAQVPGHPPGSICATQNFWCWANVYGAVGSPCTCPTAQGLVPGVYV
jgi:hypothetical protein